MTSDRPTAAAGAKREASAPKATRAAAGVTSDSPRVLRLEGRHRSQHQLTVSFSVDDLRFQTTYWYADVDLPALEERFGVENLERIYFHVAAFEANKLCCLRPDRFDLGPFARFHTPAFETLWRAVLRRVWAQWRYEHDDPDYLGPEFLSQAMTTPPNDGRGGAAHGVAASGEAASGGAASSGAASSGAASGAAAPGGAPPAIEPGPVPTLSFCGGGKDSLVAMRLLEAIDEPYDSLAYSSSIYGRAEPQHALIDRLLDRGSPRARRRMWIYDDFLDSPVARLHPELGTRYLLAGETPSSVFGALPLALAHGYRRLVVAHERSADFPNLVWERTGEAINHQWGKSAEAEKLLDDYARRELVSGVRYFSVLKPIYDVLIFNLLARRPDDFAATHSCNEHKPWCRRCAKCAYVWLNAMAYLPRETVDAVFGENLLDVAANRLFFRQMLGLEDHTPFDCLGTVDEARLAFELCRRKGLRGLAMDDYVREIGTVDAAATLERFLAIEDDEGAGIGWGAPAELRPRLRRVFEDGAAAARERLAAALAAPAVTAD